MTRSSRGSCRSRRYGARGRAMTYRDLVRRVREQHPELVRARVERICELFFREIEGRLGRGDSVSLSGLGTWQLWDRRERSARNPRTGAQMRIPAKRALAFKVAPSLRRSLNP